ncbi:DUF2306 domain-containing protein [Luteimonas viscosa]|nr:DUF2306 domain-containing protein [Luteimonas viscosa]
MSVAEPTFSVSTLPSRSLAWAARGWFAIALAGQWLFAVYILLALVQPLALGDGDAVNRTGLITGHVAGDGVGNGVLLAHVLAAALLSLGGLLQLLPWLRRHWPAWHRWAGRGFMVLSLAGAGSGLFLVWVRGSRLGDASAMAVTLNGVLIVVAAAMAWRLARQRRFAGHRRWAIRALLLVSGVWTMRLGFMAWFILNQGPRGNTPRMDGWFDIAWSFGCYLLPLAVAELYFRAERAGPAVRRAVAAVLASGALLTALGVFGAWRMMWGPHL